MQSKVALRAGSWEEKGTSQTVAEKSIPAWADL
jgi:hypothetical protein